ncbi:MFS transporter [Rossellomorea aquimaris]|uniref:MFS transporter n=1 Tax=Rossellomorea aquimaris TaxID=189382 RepID=UPI0007D07474|nr:MFS transporter [Rossellomorea aquimaris]
MGEPIELHKNHHDFPPLRRNYSAFRFMGGNLISFFGDQIYLIAIPLMVLALTGSPVSMGIVAALERVPILLQPITGILADRFNRKKLLLICDLGRGVIVGIIGLLFIFELLNMWALYVCALIVGFLSQVYNTSQFATVPNLVRKEDLQAVNSLNSGTFNSAVFIAPGIGGLIISFYNPGYALLVNSFSFFVSFLAIRSIHMKGQTQGKGSHKSFWKDMKEGFSFVIKTKPILYTNLAMISSVFGTTLFLTLMVFHLKDTIGLDASQIGWLLSFGGGAAIVGALVTSHLKKKFSYRRILFSASLIGGSSIVLFGLFDSYLLLIFCNGLGTLCASMKSPCIITIRQTLTPDALMGRVQATSRFMTWMLMPLAALLAGILAGVIGSNNTIIIGGVVSTVSSFLYLHPSLKDK